MGERLLRCTDRMFAVIANGGRVGRAVRKVMPTIAVRLLGAPIVGRRIARFGTLVTPVLLRLDPAYPPVGEVDVKGAAHQRYGAEPGAIYLVRPDGHIGFRGAETDTEALRATLRVRFNTSAPARR